MNPELQRNLILELSSRRLTWALTAVGLTYLATVLLVGVDGHGRPGELIKALGLVGGGMFVAATLIWGARQAGSAVISEVGERTWDFQRLSALSPWTMTWGKLLGATSLAWIIGLIGLALYLLYRLTDGAVVAGAREVATGLAGAVLLQAGALALALVAVRKARAEGRLAVLRNRRSALVGAFVLIAFVNGLIRGAGAVRRTGYADDLLWWGVHFSWEAFALLTIAVFAAWALVGAWRLMRLELQMVNTPWLWAGFCLFCGLYAAGFATSAWDGSTRWRLGAALAGGAFSLLTYIAAFAEPADRQRVGAFRHALRNRRWTAAAGSLPLVAPPLALATAAWLLLTALGPGGLPISPAIGGRALTGGIVGLGILLFMVRDLGVIAWVRFSPRPKRSDAGAVLALVLLYVVGGIIGSVLLGDTGRAITSPFGRPELLSVIAGAAEAAWAWWLAGQRIFGRRPSPAIAAGPGAAATA